MNKYLKNFLSFSIGTWARAIISFISTPIITYLIIPEEFGRASMFTLVLNIGIIISLFGTDHSFIRFFYEISENERKGLLWECLVISFLNTTFISILFKNFEKKLSFFLFNKYYPYLGFIFSLSLYIAVFQRFNQVIIRMQKKGLRYSLIGIVNSLVNVIATILYSLLISKSFYAVIFGVLSGNLAALIVGMYFEGSFWRPTKVRFNEISKIIKYGLPFVPTFLITWLFQSIDRIAIKQYSTLEELGLYAAAFKIVYIMNLVQVGFTTYWIPVAYERYENNKNDKEFFKKVYITISILMFMFGFFVLGFKDIIFLLLSKSYREASYIAPFLILEPIMYTISETTVIGINFTKRTYWHLVISIIVAGTNFVGNMFLVPIYGAKGAAISTGLSYVLFFALRTLISERLFKVNFEMKKIITSVGLAIIFAFFEVINKNIFLNIIFGFLNTLLVFIIYRKEIKVLFAMFTIKD